MTSEPSAYLERNRRAWNRLAEGASRFARPASDEECRDPLRALDGRGWLPPSVRGLDVLCLASGGGWQSTLYALAGARVTVVDLSPAMLELDLREAARHRVAVRVVETSMDDLSPLAEAAFDIVHQPVSTCYVPDVERVYREVARVLRDGGLYISQHKQPTSLQLTGCAPHGGYVVGTPYYHAGPLPPPTDDAYREPGAVEYLHRWEQLVGGVCRAGMILEDLREPFRGDPQAPVGDYHHRGWFVAPYVRMKARRSFAMPAAQAPAPKIWVPEA